MEKINIFIFLQKEKKKRKEKERKGNRRGGRTRTGYDTMVVRMELRGHIVVNKMTPQIPAIESLRLLQLLLHPEI